MSEEFGGVCDFEEATLELSVAFYQILRQVIDLIRLFGQSMKNEGIQDLVGVDNHVTI